MSKSNRIPTGSIPPISNIITSNFGTAVLVMNSNSNRTHAPSSSKMLSSSQATKDGTKHSEGSHNEARECVGHSHRPTSRPPSKLSRNEPRIPTSESARAPNLDTKREEPEPTISPFSLLSNRTFQTIQENTVYLAVHTCSPNNSYRYGVFIPMFKDGGMGPGWYAENAQGGPKITWSAMHEVILDTSLILLYEAGQLVKKENSNWVDDLRELEANGAFAPEDNNNQENITTVTVLTGEDRNVVRSTGVSQRHVATPEPCDSMRTVQKAMKALVNSKVIEITTPLETLQEKALKLARQLEDNIRNGRAEPLVV